MIQADVDALRPQGLSDEAVHIAVQIIAYFNCINPRGGCAGCRTGGVEDALTGTMAGTKGEVTEGLARGCKLWIAELNCRWVSPRDRNLDVLICQGKELS